jgi:hypothetical protein
MVKIYQMIIEYFNKWPQNIPNGLSIDQIAIKYVNIFRFKTLQNLPKIGIFGLKICHLAALIPAPRVPRRHFFAIGS